MNEYVFPRVTSLWVLTRSRRPGRDVAFATAPSSERDRRVGGGDGGGETVGVARLGCCDVFLFFCRVVDSRVLSDEGLRVGARASAAFGARLSFRAFETTFRGRDLLLPVVTSPCASPCFGDSEPRLERHVDGMGSRFFDFFSY